MTSKISKNPNEIDLLQLARIGRFVNFAFSQDVTEYDELIKKLEEREKEWKMKSSRRGGKKQ